MPHTKQDRNHRLSTTLDLAAELYSNHNRRLLAIANQNSSTTQDAEEALHDAFALFIDHFNPKSGAPPLAWLTLTLKRCCWATYRHQQLVTTTANAPTTSSATPRHSLAETPRQPHEIAEINDATRQIQANFKTLKPQERKALTLLALGYSYREIATLTNWTYTKVNRCITEGRAHLRKDHRSTPAKPKGAKRSTQ